MGCKQAYTKPKFEELDDAVDPWVYVVSLNLRRRHLAPHQAGAIYARLLEQRGVKRGSGARNDRTSDTVSEVASDLGVNERTMRRAIAAAETYERLPAEKKAKVDAGEVSLNEALRQSPLASDQAGCRSSVDQRPRAIREP